MGYLLSLVGLEGSIGRSAFGRTLVHVSFSEESGEMESLAYALAQTLDFEFSSRGHWEKAASNGTAWRLVVVDVRRQPIETIADRARSLAGIINRASR